MGEAGRDSLLLLSCENLSMLVPDLVILRRVKYTASSAPVWVWPPPMRWERSCHPSGDLSACRTWR